MAEGRLSRRTRSRRRTSRAGSLLAVAAKGAGGEFRADDPDRTIKVVLHLWWNSSFAERRFCDLLQEARTITKARIVGSQVQVGEPGRRRAMPYLLAVLRQLLAQSAEGRR